MEEWRNISIHYQYQYSFLKKMPVIVKQKEETLFPNGNMHLREMNTDRT